MDTVRTLADFEELLPNSRVERLEGQLRKEMKLPDEVEFATYEQPPQWYDDEATGLRRLQPAQAFFIVVSPNPHPRHQGKAIKSFAFTPIKDWRSAEAEAGHYAGVGDPALPIFKALCREHLEQRKNWTEMN